MTLPFAPLRRVLFFFVLVTVGGLMLCIDQSIGADDMIVAVDKSTLLKWIGIGMLALLAEIWRSTRSLFKISGKQGRQIAKIHGHLGLAGGDDDES